MTASEKNASPEPPLTNQEWWPNQVDVSKLHPNPPEANPLGEDFNYAKEFGKLDVKALKADMVKLMTSSQDWWPADYGHYGPLMIRMAWHGAAHIASAMAAAAQATASSGSRRSTAGQTTRASTRPAGCSGRSSRSTARRSPGLTS